MDAPKELYVTPNKDGSSWQGTEYKRSHGLIYIRRADYDALESLAREFAIFLRMAGANRAFFFNSMSMANLTPW